MDSLFEPGFFDHSNYYSSSSSSFLSFSSFSDLSPSIPEQDSTDPCDSNFFSFSSWDLDFPCSSTKDFPYARSSAPSSGSDTSSPSPSNPFQVIFGAFEAPTPAAGEIGIFHTGSKLGGVVASNRSVSSSDGWETLATPSLVSQSSTDSVALSTPSDYAFSKSHKSGFSWDDASTTLSSSSYTTPVTPAPHRVASTGSLSNPLPNPHKIRNITSMPALTEEAQPAGTFGWFDPSELSLPTPCEPVDEADLVDNFDWVFDQHGLGGMDGINLSQVIPVLSSEEAGSAVPAHTTLFSAFKESDIPILSTDAEDSAHSHFDFSLGKTTMNWLVPSNITPDVNVTNEYDLSQTLTTIDPMSMLSAPMSTYDDGRPSSAPHSLGSESNAGMLSLPTSDAMHRSHTSPAYASLGDAPYHAPLSHLPPQSIDPSSLFRPEFQRRASQPFSIQVNPSHLSTYADPQASSSYPLQDASINFQPPLMTRGVTMPARRSISEWNVQPQLTSSADAHRIAQEEMAKRNAERAETRKRLQEKVLPMMESSVMQPAAPLIAPRAGPPIVGWSGPSAPVHPPRHIHPAPVQYQGGMLTTTPLIVHPPPMHAGPSSYAPQHRVHPPPHSLQSRPIARLPSPGRRAISGPSSSPTKRSPSGRRKVTGGQGFSWESGMMFVNYTPNDADKLLSGVAPSGSQSKRKREEEAAAAARAAGEAVDGAVAEDGEPNKRSRSGE